LALYAAAMPYEEVAPFISKLREREATAALALEFCIVTAARSGEVLGARWWEIDLDKKIWTVPASRMKAGREHRVPLSSRAMGVLRQLAKIKAGDFIFPGAWRPRFPVDGDHQFHSMTTRATGLWTGVMNVVG
jgi:integrase